ncbi:MAG: hypothetical protein KJ804_13360 [Proteobacteria bacterium]|nr:hypothetical protein [Pseudomonadota bacterium]MBU1059295.1 hypothetical protein [Pseudomonadota bacterium]
MAYKRANYHNYIFVLLTALSLWAFPVTARGDVSFFQDKHGAPEKKNPVPARYRYSQENDVHLAIFQGELVKRLPGEASEKIFVDLEVDYGRLFSPSADGYLGFGYFTAKVDSDNQLRFNSSLGHFLPAVDGELFLTYRLLRSNISSSLQHLGSIHDKVYENGLSANYTRYSDGFIKEISVNYSFSAIPGQEFAESVIALDPEEIGYTAKIIGGFSDTATHEIAAKIAFGCENIGFDFLSGFKTSVHFGYEHIVQNVFHDQPDQIWQSFSTLATLEQQTSVGLIKTSYRHVESSQTLSVGYSFRDIELYMKNIQYKDRDDRQLYGVKIKFDLNTLGKAFRKKITTLFRNPTYFYKDLHQRRHIASINSDRLATQPTIRETISIW